MTTTSDRIDPREAKLPVWARHELDRLRANNRHANEKIEALTAVNGFPVAWRDPFADAPIPIARPVDTIRFGDLDRPYIDLRWVPAEHRIPSHLSIRGDDSLMIMPQSGNHVRAFPSDWTGSIS